MSGATRNIGRTYISVIMLLVLAASSIWAYRWFAVTAEVTSAENVKTQWTSAYQHIEALDTTARQICSIERALATSVNTNEGTQRRTQLLTYEQNYARIQGLYNAKMRNAFEAKLVKPSDVPDVAPSLREVKLRVCQAD